MKVVVKIFGPRYFGLPQYDVVTLTLELPEGAKVRDLLDVLDGLYGLKAKLLQGDSLRPMHDLWINGRSVDFLRGLDTELRDGDVVQVVPPFGG